MKPVPEVGKYYHFWDDGKTSPGRHYIARVERLVPIADSANIIVQHFDYDIGDLVPRSLLFVWNLEKDEKDWIFAENTDYLVEVSCPKYDENNLWFARTADGGWFSVDIQSSWQGGKLDVTGEIYDSVLKDTNLNPESYTKTTY